MGLLNIADWLFGCSHRKTTFPRTTEVSARSVTYLVCLECGRHIPYDWATMRKTRGVWPRWRGVRNQPSQDATPEGHRDHATGAAERSAGE